MHTALESKYTHTVIQNLESGQSIFISKDQKIGKKIKMRYVKVNEQVVLHKNTFENELNIDDTAPLNIEEINSRRAIEHKEIKGNEKVKEIVEIEEGEIAKNSFDDIENILK